MLEMISGMWDALNSMVTNTFTSRYLSTTLLLFLVSSLSVTALPCICSGSCEMRQQTSEDRTWSGAPSCDAMSGQDSSRDVCSADVGKGSPDRYAAGNCTCDSTADDQIFRSKQERSDWFSSGFDLQAPPVANPIRMGGASNPVRSRFRRLNSSVTDPLYLLHSSFLL